MIECVTPRARPFRILILALCVAILFAGCYSQTPSQQPVLSTTGATSSPTLEVTSPAGSTNAPVIAPATNTPIAPTATLWPSSTPTLSPVPGLVVVDAAQNLGAVSPLVYGSNVGPWQSITKANTALIEDAGFTIFRFPGGNYVDENAPSYSDLDDFISLCKQVNAEPMVQVKLVNSKPETAAAMVKYANVDQDYGIKYWSIGNEPSLYWSQRQISGYDTVTFNAEWRAFALAMKAVDPSILLLGPEIHQYTGFPGEKIVDIHYKDWMAEFLRANGDIVDIVAFHRYPFGNFEPFENELLRNSEEWDRIIPNLRQLIRSITGRELPIAVTEVNSNWSSRSGGETTPDTLLNAIWWADALGRMIEQHVDIVNQFAVAGHGGWALLGYQEVQPSYYVYKVYQQFGDQLVYSSSGISRVSAYAALRPDKALSVILINRNAEPAQVNVDIRNFTFTASATQMLLDAEHHAEISADIVLSAHNNRTLPALSVTLWIIPPTH